MTIYTVSSLERPVYPKDEMYIIFLSLNDCFSNINAIEHINEGLGHLLKTLCVGLSYFDFTL